MQQKLLRQVMYVTKLGNTFRVRVIKSDNSTGGSNVFFPRKYVALLPRHILELGKVGSGNLSELTTFEVLRSDGNKPGTFFTFKVDKTNYVEVDDMDMIAVYVPNCPDLPTVDQHLPLDHNIGMGPAEFQGMTREGKFVHEDIHIHTSGRVAHSTKAFYGGKYTSDNAKAGMCMSAIVAKSKTPSIIGFHIGGGVMGTGVMQTLTKSKFDAAFNALSEKYTISAQSCDIPETSLGKQIKVTDTVHPKAKYIHDLDKNSYIEVLGSTKMRAKTKSKVIVSPLSPHIAKHCGVPNKWGPPKLDPNWKAFAANMEHLSNPTQQFSPSLLYRAKDDYIAPLLKAVDTYKDKGGLCRKLTLQESIMGIPGMRFIDAIDMQTSIGGPLMGSKRPHFEDIYNDKKELVDRKPSKLIVDEIDIMLGKLREGKRAYPLLVSLLKDEPTKVDSEKVRVMQAMNAPFGILLREYFMPIIRFLELHPLLSESAIGINARSKNWQLLMNGVTKYAPDKKVLGLDYSKYDVRMNSQVTTMAFQIMIEIAKRMGYPSDDLNIMSSMVADVTHPLMDFNGTLIKCYNMNSSGNNLTVNINSLANSLYMRMGFFSTYPDKVNFRDHVSLITYGDDALASVKHDCRAFNFRTFKEFLARHDVKITLPDKGTNEVEFLDFKDCDFLKRTSAYIPEIGYEVGKLAEDSIFKSLHCNLSSKSASDVEVAIQCVDQAMDEFFVYGREVYDTRSEQIKTACAECGLFPTNSFRSYDERVKEWKEKYDQ
jgi:hypothetical protein